MVRTRDRAPFDADAYYTVASPEDTPFHVEPVTRAHFPEIALLFFAREGAGTMLILGITTGVLAEEPLTKLALRVDSGEVVAHVALAPSPSGTMRVHGLLVQSTANPALRNVYVYPSSAADRAVAALERVALAHTMPSVQRILLAGLADYRFEMLNAPVSSEVADEVTSFLDGCGPHFAAVWGDDWRIRLVCGEGERSDGGKVVSMIARSYDSEPDTEAGVSAGGPSAGEIAAHVGVIFSTRHPAVGALEHVLTGEKHRRRGLSSALVHAALGVFDAAGGEVCTLCTGSAYAARMYAR